MSQEQSSDTSTSTTKYDVVKPFFTAMSLFMIDVGMPQLFSVNKSVFDEVIEYMVSQGKWDAMNEDEYDAINFHGIKFDVANINNPEWLVGIYGDGTIKKISI